ncbi:MAG: hypothetical protein NVSMB26_19930 [Beijerinckiaceae bacterium]
MLAPGSFLWLVARDLRLTWRGFRGLFGATSGWRAALVLVGGFACFHALAWFAADWFAQALGDNSARASNAIAVAVLFVMPWIISQAMTSATRALYTRGDLDLLFASPLPARTILAARSVAIAVEAIGSIALLLLPVANMNALLLGPRWLAIYPALAACGLFGTAIGLLATMTLFRIAGPRRTRLVAQIAATIIGATFVLGVQVWNMLPDGVREALSASVGAIGKSRLFDAGGPLWLPMRAAGGDAMALAEWCALSIAIFAATTMWLGEAFGRDALRIAGVPEAGRRRALRAHHFIGGAGASLRRKEWRLLARDPWLMSQMLLQVIYTLPVSVIIFKAMGPNGSLALSVAPALVVIASQISASFAWLTISSEDAPEFLASAPITRGAVERGKLQAIALPILLIVGLPLIGLAIVAPGTAAIACIFGTGAAMSTAFINLWHPIPGKRGNVLRRHSQSKFVAIMEHAMSLFWAVAMMLTAFESVFAAVPIAMACGLLWLNRPTTRA